MAQLVVSDAGWKGHEFETHCPTHCVVSLSINLLDRKSSQHDLKFGEWDVTHQHKQNINSTESDLGLF